MGSGQAGGFFDVVGSSGGDGVKDDFFSGAAGQETYQHGVDFFFGIQVFFFFRYLHYVAQGSHGSRYDGDFLDGLGVFLEGAYQGVAYFMVGHRYGALLYS